MEFEKIDIHGILPQREPFIAIGKLMHYDPRTTVTSTEIKQGGFFVDGSVLSAAGLIENVAQTCAARIGYINKYILKKGIQIGFIGAVRDFEISRLPSAGETITTTIDVIEDIFGMTLVKARVEVQGEILAEGEMKIAVREME